MNLVERKFAHFQQQQLFGVGLKDLPAQFTANAAPCTSHQHCFAVRVEVQQQAIGLDRLATQQVVNVKFAHITQSHLAGGNIAEAWQCTHCNLMQLKSIQNLVAPLARYARQCQKYVGDGREVQHLC